MARGSRYAVDGRLRRSTKPACVNAIVTRVSAGTGVSILGKDGQGQRIRLADGPMAGTTGVVEDWLIVR
jgi:hypothetical protein